MSFFSFENIVGGYGDTHVISGITSEVESGRVLGVFGRNGVGKTSLSRLLSGHLPLASGKIQLDGKDLSLLPAYLRRSYGLGYLPQTEMVFDNLTVKDNLELCGTPKKIDSYLQRFPHLNERWHQKAGTMSGGERKILGFARSMLEDTSAVILDEPTEGVQSENVDLMLNCIMERKSAGTAIILIEQHINLLVKAADFYLGIDSGRAVYQGDAHNTPPEKILELLTI